MLSSGQFLFKKWYHRRVIAFIHLPKGSITKGEDLYFDDTCMLVVEEMHCCLQINKEIGKVVSSGMGPEVKFVVELQPPTERHKQERGTGNP